MQMIRDVSCFQETTEIYIAIARSLLEVYGPEILSYCYMDHRESRATSPGISTTMEMKLPSWVPDWRKYSNSLQGYTLHWLTHLYRTSDCFPATSRSSFAVDRSLLSISGLFVDTIQPKAERFTTIQEYSGLKPGPWFGSDIRRPFIKHCLDQPLIRRIWSTWRAPSSEPPVQDKRE